MFDATQTPTLPPMPGCGRRATVRLHIHSRTADGVYTPVSEVLYCDDCTRHAYDAILAAGMQPHRATLTRPGHCGGGAR